MRRQAQVAIEQDTAAAAMDDRTLGEYVVCFSRRLQSQGWHKLITGCRLPTDFATNVQRLPH